MKTTARILIVILSALLLLSAAGCAKDPADVKGDNAEFVKAAARAVTDRTDRPELFYADEGAIQYDLVTKPTLQPYFALLGFKAEQDEEDLSLVHYSCKIPGAVGLCFNMAYDVCFTMAPRYSKAVAVEGDIRVVTGADGTRRIDISEGDNVFAAYAALRYVNPLFFKANGIDISHGLSDEDFSDGLFVLLNRACDGYARALGVDGEEYAGDVILPELETFQANMRKIVRGSTCEGYGFRNWYRGVPGSVKAFVYVLGGMAVLFLLFVVAQIFASLKDRKNKPKKVTRAQRVDYISGGGDVPEVLKGIAEQAGTFAGYGRFVKSVDTEWVRYDSPEQVHAAAKMAAVLAHSPDSKEDGENTLRFLCKNIHLGLRNDSVPVSGLGGAADTYRREMLTAAGWSAAALGRILARQMTPDEIAGNLEKLGPAIDRSNETIDRLQDLYKKRDLFMKRIKGRSENEAVPKPDYDDDEIKSLETEYSRGLGGYMLDNGDKPLAYLVYLLRDSQNRFPRFIKQGVIMGLVDWLVENRTHPEAAKLLQTVVSVRNDMIRSNSELTFFEVRAPGGCTRKDYAALLADVLHCANPSLRYGDTEKLLEIAEKEVPGVMEMLYACPLRLIDPANRGTMGFYQFKPYVHAMWVQYVPPLREGKVISRYHEVDDRTKPLSSGLNLQLFRDCYAVIPTLFHEYQHFMGDRNEASVFLKTQLFSIRFYKAYKDADAKSDGVFAQLTDMLGLPPSIEKRQPLNAIIERYYGKQVSREEGVRRADAEIHAINEVVDMANEQETWDPDVKMPRLSLVGDKENYNLIRDVVIRFATVPKSITEQEFKNILENKGQTAQQIAGKPFSPMMTGLVDELGMTHSADRWFDGILQSALGSLVGAYTENSGEAEEVSRLLRSNGLDLTDCRNDFQVFLFDPAASDCKSLPKYMKLAAAAADLYGSPVIRAEHMMAALLSHPTKCMKKAGIKGKKR